MAKSSTTWKKGRSMNPGGRPKEYFATKDYARKKCPWAFERLEQIAKQDDDLKAAYSACMGILAYGIGKPVERIDLTNSDGSMSAAWLAAMRSVDNETEQGEAEASVQH